MTRVTTDPTIAGQSNYNYSVINLTKNTPGSSEPRISHCQFDNLKSKVADNMAKLIVIIGITGNQGGSVAHTFLNDPSWRIRGLTRDTRSPASHALSAQGIEMVQANLQDPLSLTDVFKGANLVFSVTDFWKPYFDPDNRARAQEQGKSIGEYAYELEVEQGKNIVDAVAREVDGLGDVGLIASTLCSARESSGGKYQELWHFDGKADVFPKYLQERYPELARKTSFLHTGYFFTSWQFLPGRWFAKVRQLRHKAGLGCKEPIADNTSYPMAQCKCNSQPPPTC